MALRALGLLILILITWPADAQTQKRSAAVYRCGPDGRDLRDSPCPGAAPGAAASGVVEFDQPSAADSQAARQRQLADAKRATEMARERKRVDDEARAQRRAAVGLQAAPSPEAASQPAKHPPKTPKSPKLPKAAKAPQPNAPAKPVKPTPGSAPFQPAPADGSRR
jgi:hypothetical protein